MLTYQDFLAAPDRAAFIQKAINEHNSSELVRTAHAADEYNRQRNITVRTLNRLYMEANGAAISEADALNARICSNFFRTFCRQRCSYLLGNGISFTRREWQKTDDGEVVKVDVTKERLGVKFDGDLYAWGYLAIIHGVSYGYWDGVRLHVFPVTGFAPLIDEDNNTLRAGIRYWRLANNKPLIVELYEEQGRTEYRSRSNAGSSLIQVDKNPRPYRIKIARTEADGEWVVGSDNYGSLPVIPMYGNDMRQSALVGFRESIDAYDCIKSGFISDVNDMPSLYWILQNQNAMTRPEMLEFLGTLRRYRIANVGTDGFVGQTRDVLTPYSADIPYGARTAILKDLQDSMYRDFPALDVHAVAAGATNDHIDAAYQPLDDAADAFETEVTNAIQQLLALDGIEDTPQYQRNRVYNLTESVNAIAVESRYLDEDTIIDLMPNLTVDQKEAAKRNMAGRGEGHIEIVDNPQTPAE